jgi:hypothetical protein
MPIWSLSASTGAGGDMTKQAEDTPRLFKRHEPAKRPPSSRSPRPPTHRQMNTILNAFFVLTRAQLVDPRLEPSSSDPIDETGVQLTTFRTHAAYNPIAEPLYEPPLVDPYSENEKVMMYGSTSSVDRGHFRGTSSVRLTWLSQVCVILRLMAAGLGNDRLHYLNRPFPLHGEHLSIVRIILRPL